jgi:tetratricopeptide (TPR) repeat protein
LYEGLGDVERASKLREQAVNAPVDHAGELWYINREHRRLDPNYSLEKSLEDHREMLRFDSAYYNGLFFMSYLLSKEGRHAEALIGWYGCIAQHPDDSTALRNLVVTHILLGNYSEASAAYELKFSRTAGRPADIPVLNDLAWWLVTCPHKDLRDAARAVTLARHACQLTEYKDPITLDTLATAYAATGDFESAVTWSEKAIELAGVDAVQLKAHLSAFKAGNPWEEPRPDANASPGPRENNTGKP